MRVSTASVALVVISCLTLCHGLSQGQGQSQGQDATRVAGESGFLVVNAVIDTIHSTCILSEDRLFLRRVAYAMSEDGTASHTYQPGSGGGIWKVPNTMFLATKACNNIWITKACDIISSELGIQWTTVAYSELNKPLYSGLAAALYTLLQMKGQPMPGSISSQALKWGIMYGEKSSLTFLRTAKLPKAGCDDELDLAFVMDSSLSVGDYSFQLMLSFAAGLVGSLNLSSNAVRVTGIAYSTNVHLIFGLNGYSSKANAQFQLLSTHKEGLGTNTNLGLDQAATSLYDTSGGARQNAKKVVLLITDGRSNVPINTEISAKNIKDLGTTVFAVGVGRIDKDEMNLVASEPPCSHVLTLTSYAQFAALHDLILKSICESNFMFTPNNSLSGNTTGNVTAQGNVPGNNQTIQVSVSCGILDVFVSTTNPRPSSAVHSNHYRGTPGQPATLTVTETLPSGTLVYVTIVGTNLPPIAAQARNCSDYSWSLGIVPTPPTPPVSDTMTVAIEGGGPKGRLIATLNGQEGTVCDDAATNDLAAVVCRQLGYSTAQPRIIPVTTPTNLPIVMDDAFCTGSESTLADCMYVKVHNCDHSEDIGVDCSPPDPCDASPCQNGGQCTGTGATTFTCQCTADYSGDRCQTYVDPCGSSPSPCQNGGGCTRVDASTFTCQCTADYTGDRCQTYIDPCSPTPCENQGRCTRLDATTYSCLCTADYTGYRCQTLIDPCGPSPCQNGGTCTRVDASTFTCQCTADYAGDKCQTYVDPCDSSPCQNGGTCTRVGASTFTCQCTADYTGDKCQTYVNPCDSKPCQNGGTCTRVDASSFTCQCNADYTGDKCQTYIDPCDPSPCQNGGTCTRVDASTFTCQCTADYNGDECQSFIDPCDPSPCQNGGTCTRVDASTFTCQCTADYNGDECQSFINPWGSSPCQNGGQCTRVGASTFNYQCTADYTGDRCQTYIDPCDPSPCQNGGQCTRVDASTFTCQCTAGYSGDTCQTPVANPCAPNPCQNGGQCTAVSSTDFDCQCTVDYTGDVCDILIDPCDSQPCQNNGTCVRNSVSTFECLCFPGTNGTLCEISDICWLGYHNVLTTFNGENGVVSVPCTYDVVDMRCRDFTVKASATSASECQTSKCFKDNVAYVLATSTVTIQSSQVTWEGSLDYTNFQLTHTVTGDGSLVTLDHDPSANRTVLATSDNVLSVTLSHDTGFRLMCSDFKSSKEYPSYLCGSGTSGGVTIQSTTNDLNLPNTFSTLAYEIMMNPNIEQQGECKKTSGILQNQCDKPIEAVHRCNRCFREKTGKTKLSCLDQCLVGKGQCRKTP